MELVTHAHMQFDHSGSPVRMHSLVLLTGPFFVWLAGAPDSTPGRCWSFRAMGTLPGIRRSTVCLAETTRAKHGDITRSVPPAYVKRQPIRIRYISVRGEVSGCPVLSPGDSALRHKNPSVHPPAACDLRVWLQRLTWGVRWRPRAGRMWPEEWHLPLSLLVPDFLRHCHVDLGGLPDGPDGGGVFSHVLWYVSRSMKSYIYEFFYAGQDTPRSTQVNLGDVLVGMKSPGAHAAFACW